MPFGFNFLSTSFNTFLMASLISVAILFRSWTSLISVSIIRSSFLYCTIFFLTFFYAYLNYSFVERVAISSLSLSILCIWQLSELKKTILKDSSIHLKFIFGFITISLILCLTRLIICIQSDSADSQSTFFYNESQHAQLVRLIFSCSILLTYVFISNYFYHQLVTKEKKSLKRIKEKDKKLNLTIKAKNNLSKIIRERELLMAKLLASNKLSSTSALSATIAHELNQPLGAIQLNSQHLEMRLREEFKNHPELEAIIKNILKDNQRASGIVKTLRSMFLDRNTEYTKNKVNHLIENLKSIMLPVAYKYQVNLIFKLNSKSSILVNENEFIQVMLNLFNNAIDATKSINRNKEIVITTQDKTNKVLISVSDNGVGIDNKMKKTLFELLKTNKKDGSGIGLWLAKYVVEKSHGSINFKDSSKHGVTFIIEMPQAH